MNRRSLLKNTLLLTCAGVVMQVLSLLFQVYLSRRVGAEGIGRLRLMLTAGGFALTAGVAGMRVAVMNLTAARCGRADDAGRKRVVLACLRGGLVCSAICGGALALMAEGVVARWIHAPAAAPALRLLALGLPANCLTAVLDGYFTARGKIKPLVLTELGVQLAEFLLTILLLRNGVYAAVAGSSTVSAFLGLIPLLLLLRRDLHGIPKSTEPVLRPLLQLAVPLALGDWLRAGLRTAEQFLIPMGLERFAGSESAAMADYGTIGGMVFPVLMFPVVLFQALSDLLVSELSRCKAQGSTLRIRYIAGSCLRTGLIFSALIAGLMGLLAPALGELLYESEAAGRYLRIFSPMILMLYMDALTDGMLKGLGEQLAGVRYNTFTAALDVVLLLLLLPRMGIAGYLVSFFVTHGVNFYLSIGRLFHVTGYRTGLRHTFATLGVLAGTVLVCRRFAVPGNTLTSVVCCGVVFAGVFLLFSIVVGVLRPKELRQFF